MARYIFMEVTDPDTTVGQHPAVTLTDALTEIVYHQFLIPSDFTILTAATIFLVAGGTGNMVYTVITNWGEICSAENYNTHADSIPITTMAMTVNQISCMDIMSALTGVAAGDLVGISLTRFGGHVSDTINANCAYLGIRVAYN